jgi:hypothetical protein
VGADRLTPSHKGRCSAARLSASVRGRLAGEHADGDQCAALKGVSGARACAAGALLLYALRRVPEPVHREPLTGKPDAGNPPVRFGRAGRSPNLPSDPHPPGLTYWHEASGKVYAKTLGGFTIKWKVTNNNPLSAQVKAQTSLTLPSVELRNPQVGFR